ncbi:hypothetical protein HCN51_44660 [Nonomuraea sp. FMUSA5-5]|uniref:Uncharacterized protein n=1 Tax=Nonomuraea composti TaxID=2720023 RepID=A0ABX1BNW5_9ACTN|nr:hypothetical protein [Nonomuraea sp. FMUSA5-5]NJP96448.1 hypothetical protein [Nonomuraea sp. FMUSA5-5]
MVDSPHLEGLRLDPGIRDLLTGFRQHALYNYGEMIAVKQVVEHPVDHDEIEQPLLTAVTAVFAEPDNFDDLFNHLRAPGSVLVLNLPPNAGRTTLAYALLARLQDEGLTRQVRTLRYGGASDFPIRRLPHEKNQGFLLVLPADEEESEYQVSPQFGSRIHTLTNELRSLDNRLIVLTYPQQWRRISMGAPEGVAPAVSIVAPSGIAASWLAAEEPNLPRQLWLNNAEIQKLLRGGTPTDTLQIVDLIMSAHRKTLGYSLEQPNYQADTDEGRAEFHKLVTEVTEARRNWRGKLLEWHRAEGRTSVERNFLLAASVLRGAPVANVYASAAALSTTFKEKAELSTSGQSSPGVIELLDTVEGEVTEKGTITFVRPGWDDAVLEYFWTDRPLARRPFLTWLAEAPIKDRQEALEGLTQQEREALAQRIVSFALRWAVRHRRQEPLSALAAAWHTSQAESRTRRMWNVLIELLSSAAAQETSSYLHEMLLNWSKSDRPALQTAVIAVCASDFGQVHTVKAFRRLKKAATPPDTQVTATLRVTVRKLWAEAHLRQALLEFITNWCREPGEEGAGGHQAFAALASAPSPTDPSLPLLLDSSDEQERDRTVGMLPIGWTTLLDQEPGSAQSAEAKDAVRLWMSAALHDERLGEPILGSLRQAVAPRGPEGSQRRRDRLRTYVVAWSQEGEPTLREQRETMYARLSQLLDNDLSASVQQQLHQYTVDEEP